jgi:RNA recognition motif-containing protein
MATDAEAPTAIQKLNDQPFQGRRIIVQRANSSGQRSGGGGGQRRTPRW